MPSAQSPRRWSKERMTYWLVIFILGLGLWFVYNRSLPYAIVVDNEVVAWLRDKSIAENAIKLAHDEATRQHPGINIGFKESTQIDKRRRPSSAMVSDAVSASARLLSVYTVYFDATVIQVNGYPILATPDADIARQALSALKHHYAKQLQDLVSEPSFRENIEIKRQLIEPKLFVKDLQAAKERLIYGIQRPTFHKVKPGDVAGRIALHYAMRLSELERMNDGRNLTKIRIGENLRVSTGKPQITVICVRRSVKKGPIPPQEKRVVRPRMKGGQIIVAEKGRPGIKDIISHITLENGILIKSEIVEEREIKSPVHKLILVGGGERSQDMNQDR